MENCNIEEPMRFDEEREAGEERPDLGFRRTVANPVMYDRAKALRLKQRKAEKERAAVSVLAHHCGPTREKGGSLNPRASERVAR